MASRIDLLKQYLEEDPDDAFTMYALALEHIKLGEDHLALPLMQKLFDQHPAYLPNYYHFGKLLNRNGASKEAEMVLKKGMDEAKHQRDFHTLSELENEVDS